MNLVERQFLDTKSINSMLNVKFKIIVVGSYRKNAVNSIREQLYTNYSVDEIDIYEEWDEMDKKLISNAVCNCVEEYVLFLNGGDCLTKNALLEYARDLAENKKDILYADEGVWSDREKKHMNYIIKPKAEPIAYLQNMYIGSAVVFKTNAIKFLIDDLVAEDFDSMIVELFYKVLINRGNVANIPLILSIKQHRPRNVYYNSVSQLYLTRAIEANKLKWQGVVSKAKSYNIYGFELQDEKVIDCEFLIFSISIHDTIQLLSQVRISYSKEHIVIIASEKDFSVLEKKCKEYGICNVEFIEKANNMKESINRAQKRFVHENQLVMNDSVRWLNRMNVETLKQCFFKKEVGIATPQIATEGENPLMVYGGDDIDSLALTGNYYKGRSQGIQSEYDLQWINRRVTSINEYVFLIRKEIWKDVLPLDESIKTCRHLAIELSLKCVQKGIICEYSAQSCFWVKEEIVNYYTGKSVTGKNGWESEPRLSGCYMHWLREYADIIKRKKNIPYALQSYKPYLKDGFKAYFPQKIESDKLYKKNIKRVLVFTHELSLTGAPIVLVHAVTELKKMGYLPLVVSPIDGPLKHEYELLQVPVIIEPRLYENYEYIHVAYDFDFVIACTICLWQVVEQLGKTDIPVLWWIHDSEMGYRNYLKYVLPDSMPKNIHIYAGGDYAQRVLKKYRPKYDVNILLYGLEDFSLDTREKVKKTEWNLPEDMIVFANIAQIISRKGQDVLVSAIRKLPEQVLKKCAFVFVGGVVDRKIYNQIIQLCNDYPQNVRYIKQISHSKLKEFYRAVDALICSSTDDPLPAFIAEGMMMSDLCICSRNTAFNSIIENDISGYLFESGDSDELMRCICSAVDKKGKMVEIGKNARKKFADTFGLDVFRKNLGTVIRYILDC